MSAWAYNERPAGVRFLPDTVAEPGRGEIEDQMWAWIVRGSDDAAAFVDYLDDDEDRHGVGDEELAAAYERAVDARRAQQREWGDVRSNVSLAFAELNQLGVLARANFSCCGTCASGEIHDERDGSRHWHGYLWFHQQDTEALIASTDGSVYLGYGVYPPEDFDEAAYEALSPQEQRDRYQADLERMLDDLVFPVLRRHGMRVTWNRNQATRILVTGAHWYVPLT
ncbi:hypothetical protein Daura_17575 [Dactylosporangium aurantiacum]|uniref:DUF6891 domain-containing protein n=1 Tax=Dactylosporangium aurantiacum TaxID=35754 RepID=A0A9Q9IPU5_9ACTN|nr:hypothetical protein [Dactylosporangium aurantiacum]MDG6103317.1 hypothetical protein [Dactylosporangium aurantiacum]UWZ57815.1 hypothetical protein Daura_17575 [Dactylosporangium aurantiacum]